MTETSTKQKRLVVHEDCIDLPGEAVQCWISGGVDKLKVTLRKHRDVIFDINLGNGKTYSVEATQSDFYNARDKKIVLVAQHEKVTFKDGERMHVWVSRGFRGALILRSGESVLCKVEPNEWDKHRYSDDPKEKPAPIIIAISGTDVQAAAQEKIAAHSVPAKPEVPRPVVAASVHSPQTQGFSCPVVCVIDGKLEGMPADLVEHFKKGGDHTGLADIDPNHVATRNWLWSQAAIAGAYVKDNWEWLRAGLEHKTGEGFKLVKAQVRYVRGQVRFYFSGYSNSNTVFGRGGFGPSSERIMTIFGGIGKSSSAAKAVVKNIANGFKEYSLISFIFGSATAIAEWKDDARKDGYDLAAALFVIFIKSILIGALTELLVVIAAGCFMILFGVSMPVVLVGSAWLVLGFAANYVVESADKAVGRVASADKSNNDGVSPFVSTWFKEISNRAKENLRENWKYLMRKMSNDYLERVF